jgi:hypothetical protein
MKTVSVAPAGEGWAVSSDLIDNLMIFKSGAKAEDAAVRLGRAISVLGRPVQIRILLRDGGVVSKPVFSPLLRAA